MTDSDNKVEYDRLYSSRHYNVASVYDHIVRIRQRYLTEPGRLLDHGFGNGVNALYFHREGFDVVGVDTSKSAVELASENCPELQGKFRLIQPGDSLPFDDGTFDAIVSNQVLYFVPSRKGIEAVCAEFARVLKPGGKVACTIMAEDNYFFTDCGQGAPQAGPTKVVIRGRIERNYLLYRVSGEQEVRSFFEGAGLVVEDLGYFDYRLLDVKKAKHYIVLARKPD